MMRLERGPRWGGDWVTGDITKTNRATLQLAGPLARPRWRCSDTSSPNSNSNSCGVVTVFLLRGEMMEHDLALELGPSLGCICP
jgi:hypothetical protein